MWGRAQLPEGGTNGQILFQFTPPCGGGRVESRRRPAQTADFNSRPRVGAGFPRHHFYPPYQHFNSRPRVGAGEGERQCLIAGLYFNSRPRVGAGRMTGSILFSAIPFQFTPPCGGGLTPPHLLHLLPAISIHAPVWGRAKENAPSRRR